MKLKLLSLGTLLIASILFTGCSSKSEPVMTSTLKATDYTMSCESLSSEIQKYEKLYKEQIDGSLTETLTFGMVGSDEEVEIMLRERIKNLELIYAMKQLKGECQEVKQDTTPQRSRVILNFTEKKSEE